MRISDWSSDVCSSDLARLTDLRDAARILKGRKVAPGVRAMISPGSSGVRRAAEAEGIDRIFIEAGFEWRRSGCSLCLAMNDDSLAPGERCASSRSEEHTSELQSLTRTSYAVFCLQKKKKPKQCTH